MVRLATYHSRCRALPSRHPNPTRTAAFLDPTIYQGWIRRPLECEIAHLSPAALARLEDAR